MSQHESLPEGDERFRLLVENVRDYAIFILDPTGRVVTWNEGARLIKGYRADEIIGLHFSTFYPPKALQRGLPDHELRVAAAEGRFEDEGWRVRKDGSLFWANVVITALRDQDGVLRGFGKVTRDLTQRRHSEETLRQSEERFRLLVEGIADYAMFMLDANGYIVTWNNGAQRIKGYTAAEIVGQHFSKFYPQDVRESGWPEHELQVATSEGRFEEEGWRLRKDGSRFWASVTITALRDQSGRLRGFAKLTRDLSERQRSETLQAHTAIREEMLDAERKARLEAQRAARIKDEFLATLSHELRQPLNAILGWTHILRSPRGVKPDDLQRGMEVIDRNARAQVQLIEDLLDLSRIISGRIRLDLQPVALIEVVRETLESAQPTAVAKGVRLESDLDAQSGTVSGDPGRLQQVLWNLVSNAVKFTPKGGTVRVALERRDSALQVRVSDTGIGIPANFLPHVFERFSQKDSTASRSHGGLGLGLAISKQLVELHGGSVEATSAGEGMGATFTVTFPQTSATNGNQRDRGDTPPSLPAESAALPQLDDVRVLVVDDEEDARELIRRVLEDRGASVTLASSADEALRILATASPDVLVSDIGMPGMDGYQFMREVRATETRDRRLPAVALTAFARTEDRTRAMLAGYQAHVAKPFDVAELVLVVAGLASSQS